VFAEAPIAGSDVAGNRWHPADSTPLGLMTNDEAARSLIKHG
jgi:hypothetical protein